MGPGRSRVLKPAAAVIALLLCLCGSAAGGYRLIVLRSAEALARHQREIPQIIDCVHYKEPGEMTPPPWGPDNLWDHVRPVFQALRRVETGYTRGDGFWMDGVPDFRSENPDQAERDLEPHGAMLEICRRAVARSDRAWRGEWEATLPDDAAQTCRHLCTRGWIAGRKGRDVEAVDWILTALTIAHEAARVESRTPHQTYRWNWTSGVKLRRTIEGWAYAITRQLLRTRGMSLAALEDFGRRLDRLRQDRPAPRREAALWGATARHWILEYPEGYGVIDGNAREVKVDLLSSPGWRDLYSPKVRTARVLGRIRDNAFEAGRQPWRSSAEFEPHWLALCRGRLADEAGRLWAAVPDFHKEYAALLRWDLLRVAVGIACFDAANGRMPVDLDEAGVGGLLLRPVRIEGRSLVLELLPPGSTYNVMTGTLDPPELEWTIVRR